MASQKKTVQFDLFKAYYLKKNKDGSQQECLYDLTGLLQHIANHPFSDTKKKIFGDTQMFGFLTGFGLYLMKIPDLVMPRLEFLLNAIISCATTVSGFIISSVAILIGATESQIMIKIKRFIKSKPVS